MCNDNNLQELLPAYLEKTLGTADSTRVEQHLAFCEDCRLELALLRVIADDPVPAQDEAFWTGMPDRIYREVQASEQRDKKRFALSDLLSWMSMPRLAWATAAVNAIAAVSWFMVRSATMDVYRTAQTAEENSLSLEPVDIQQLSPGELDGAAQWAENQLAPIGEALSRYAAANRDNDLFDDLWELNDQELNAVYTQLKNKERDSPGKPTRSSARTQNRA